MNRYVALLSIYIGLFYFTHVHCILCASLSDAGMIHERKGRDTEAKAKMILYWVPFLPLAPLAEARMTRFRAALILEPFLCTIACNCCWTHGHVCATTTVPGALAHAHPAACIPGSTLEFVNTLNTSK